MGRPEIGHLGPSALRNCDLGPLRHAIGAWFPQAMTTTMTMTKFPETEADLLAAASGVTPDVARQRAGRLSELERTVLDWSAPFADDALPDREIARRLGMHPNEVRRARELAACKLRHPSFSG